MRTSERIQSIDLRGPAGPLEALLHLEIERAPAVLAVVCHPHPLYGGSMQNKVVHRLDRALFATGAAVVRFNYRGVGRSAGRYSGGEGERDDTRAVLLALAARYPETPLILAGFSFGAARALEVGLADPNVARVIAVGLGEAGFGALPVVIQKPVLFVHGAEDELAPVEPTRAKVASLSGPVRWVEIAGSGHFFDRHLDALEAEVRAWLTASGSPAPPAT